MQLYVHRRAVVGRYKHVSIFWESETGRQSSLCMPIIFDWRAHTCKPEHHLQATVKHDPEPDVKSWKASESWYLTTQAGPQFAALNGDINFIHLHPILARLFGFKSNIAHGTYLVSKTIAAMQAGTCISSRQPCCVNHAPLNDTPSFKSHDKTI